MVVLLCLRNNFSTNLSILLVYLKQMPTFEALLFFISFRGHEQMLLPVWEKIIKTRPTMGELHAGPVLSRLDRLLPIGP